MAENGEYLQDGDADQHESVSVISEAPASVDLEAQRQHEENIANIEEAVRVETQEI